MNLESNLFNNVISQIAAKLELYIQQDPGKCGLNSWALQGNLFPGTLSLSGGNHIIITTGFYILSSGVIETDGPPGVIILVKALELLGKEVTIVTDKHAVNIIKAGLDVIKCKSDIVTIEDDYATEIKTIIKDNTTHIVALERPGLASDGLHHNFKGNIITDFVAPTDDLYKQCSDLGIITIGIGDGGNELGMGNVVKDTKSINNFSCLIRSDYCICSGVSNWAGYAIAGLLSILNKKNLLPNYEEFNNILESIVTAGAVDGVTGKKETTVDGLDRSWEENIYKYIFQLCKEF